MKKYRSRELRKGRVSIHNHVYLVTTVTFQRQPFFTNFDNARLVVDALRFSQQKKWAETLAFVLMPDHLHWLFALGKTRSLSQLVHSVKSFTATKISGNRGRATWQPGFHDRAIRADEDLRDVARYVIANPVRADLVEHIGQYSWWDAVWVGGDSFDWC